MNMEQNNWRNEHCLANSFQHLLGQTANSFQFIFQSAKKISSFEQIQFSFKIREWIIFLQRTTNNKQQQRQQQSRPREVEEKRSRNPNKSRIGAEWWTIYLLFGMVFGIALSFIVRLLAYCLYCEQKKSISFVDSFKGKYAVGRIDRGRYSFFFYLHVQHRNGKSYSSCVVVVFL